ncbi:hypothetical protein ACFQS7_13030 [Dankookia sp. GCM10030260]|uniref:hypothetical protein n=1 Tax=Dankookia sp. GCM10030260 TaxID=3273390 RepID=UPI0036166985
MAEKPNMRPDQSKNPGEDYALTTAGNDGPDGPAPLPRDARPESAYPKAEREVGVNRKDAAAPSGPVNIKVKDNKPDDSGPQAAGQTEDRATGGGSRDASGLPDA